MKLPELNLSAKIIGIVLAGVVLLFFLMGVVRVFVEKGSLMQQMETSGQERATLVAEALSNLVLAYDYGNIESLAERIVKMEDVLQVRVLDRRGKQMVSRRDEKKDAQAKWLEFSAPIVFLGENIGKVELVISLDRYEAGIRKVYRNVVSALSIFTIFFVALIYLLISSLIVRPLARLSGAADQLAIGNYDTELPQQTHDEMGRLVRAFSFMRESRRLNEARLKAVFDHSPDAFIHLDAEGNIIDWNEKAQEIWGYAKTEMIAKNFSEVMPPAEMGLNKGYRKCYQKSVNIIGVIREVVGQRKDQTLFPLELRTSEVHFGDNVGFLVLARDITERKEYENRLREARLAAEAASSAKSAFLSNMSHEIRTPMNSIIGMTHLMFKTSPDVRQQDYLSKIDYSARHLLGLINDILDFSKIEAHKLELEEMSFEVPRVFDNLAGQLSYSASSKGLQLGFVCDTGLTFPMLGDPIRIAQILMNFIGNAIKFTEQGEIRVECKLLEQGTHDALLRFDVRDTGIGMEREEISNLFRPFHQADASTTRKYGGTGLGLAICKQLAELMDGKVGVKSQPGLGSDFWFEVRLRKAEKKTMPDVHEMQIDVQGIAGASILLVEDNAFNQQVAQELLSELGARISLAGNGLEAIEMLRAGKYDCVLMDVQMPVMDGLEATRRIRSDPALQDTLIIAMTANAGREDRERCFEAGMDGFVSKPIFAENLYEVLAGHLRQSKEKSDKGNGEKPISTEVCRKEDGKNENIINRMEENVIDLNVLAKMVGSDPAKLQKFAQKFLISASQGLVEIDAAIAEADMQKIAALGHRNKSPARTVGAMGYADLCQSLEKFKNCGDLQEAQQTVAQMKQLLETISRQIEAAFPQK